MMRGLIAALAFFVTVQVVSFLVIMMMLAIVATM